MAEDFDPYSAARERVRESVRWLYGVAAGVAAVLFATISWGSLPKVLNGDPLAIKLVAILLGCVLASIWSTLRVISSRPYGLKELTRAGNKLAGTLDSDYKELFSTEAGKIQGVASMVSGREGDEARFQRVLSFASYLDQQRKAVLAQWVVAVSAIVGATALGILVNHISEQEEAKPARMELTLSGESIEALADALRNQ